jgi:hypothetical protein
LYGLYPKRFLAAPAPRRPFIKRLDARKKKKKKNPRRISTIPARLEML